MGEYLRHLYDFLPASSTSPRTVEDKEITTTIPLYVYNEPDPLRTIALWGPPGSETVLAQLMPSDQNLFYNNFNVSDARIEYTRMQDFLKQHGIEIILIQDQLLKNFDRSRVDPKNQVVIPKTVNQLISDLKTRAMVLYRKYGVGDLSTVDLIPELIEEDIDRLGEEQAILLNWMLSLRHMLPSGNIFYGRDQSNVLGDKIIWSQMRWPIRKPEVGMYKIALEGLLGKNQQHRIRGKEAYFEGGDGIMMDGDIYLGVGGRTTFAGAYQVFEGVEDYLNREGKKMILIVDEETERRTHHQTRPGQEQQTMHLDTFWMPFGNGRKVLCCMEEVEKRNVYQLNRINGIIYRILLGSFPDFLKNEQFQIFDIPKQEQLEYATNFLNIDNNTVIVPFSHNEESMKHFSQTGIRVFPVEITTLGGGYGAIHCMTSALYRGK